MIFSCISLLAAVSCAAPKTFTFTGYGEVKGLFRVYAWDGAVRARLPWPAQELKVPLAALARTNGPHRVALDMDGVRWRLRVDEQTDEDWLTDPVRIPEGAELPPLECLPPEPAAKRVVRPIQFWTPDAWNAWVGDVALANWKGRLHVFYLYDRRHHGSKAGRGGHYFAHLSSADLRTWEEHPAAVFPEDVREYIGTGGSIAAEDGSLWLCYGLHTGRHDPAKVGGFPRGGRYARSTDGIRFTKCGALSVCDENPFPFRRSDGLIELVHSGFASEKGRWTARTLAGPWTKEDDAIPSWGDCPCPFEWRGWHYLLQGFVCMAASPTGKPGSYEDWVASGEDIYDGLSVPMVVPWGADRRLLVGWVNGLRDGASGCEPEQMWGGWLCFRELVRFDDGRLGTRWLPETLPADRPLEFACTPERPLDVVFRNERGTPLHFQVFPREGRAQFSDDGSRRRTLAESAEGMTPDGPDADHRRNWQLTRDRHDVPHHCANYAIGRIRGLDRPFAVRILLHYDPKADATLFDAEIAGTRTMLARRRGRFSLSADNDKKCYNIGTSMR